MFQTYGKAILAFLYACAFVAIPLYTGDHHIDPGEGVTIAIAVVTNAGVWLIPLAPSAKWTKTAAGVLLAGLEVATVVILDHIIDANDVMMIAAAVLGALGITAAPATSPKTLASVGWGVDR
jgi:hypothetical protein